MANMTRRKLLWTTSTGAVAAAGVAALIGFNSRHTTANASASGAQGTGAASGTIVAVLVDATTNTVSVQSGTAEVVSNNATLASAMRQAAGA